MLPHLCRDPFYRVMTLGIISCTAAFAIYLKLATSVCLFLGLFPVKLCQGLKVSAD